MVTLKVQQLDGIGPPVGGSNGPLPKQSCAHKRIVRTLAEGQPPPVIISVKSSKFKTTGAITVSYTHLRAHETVLDIVCRLLLEKKKTNTKKTTTQQ